MIILLSIVKLNVEYCNYLRQYDNKVPYNFGEKVNRPYVGVLFDVDDCSYFAPLSSPKPKHLTMKNKMDFLKIDDGKLGAINFNNMLPVKDQNVVKIDLNKNLSNEYDIKYNNMLKRQIYWLNRHHKKLYDKSRKLYYNYKEDKLPYNIKVRCCNFPLLEEKCHEYNK